MRNNNDYIALKIACETGNVEKVKSLYEKGYHPFKEDTNLLFHLIIMNDHLELAKYLLQMGTPIDHFTIQELSKTESVAMLELISSSKAILMLKMKQPTFISNSSKSKIVFMKLLDLYEKNEMDYQFLNEDCQMWFKEYFNKKNIKNLMNKNFSDPK